MWLDRRSCDTFAIGIGQWTPGQPASHGLVGRLMTEKKSSDPIGATLFDVVGNLLTGGDEADSSVEPLDDVENDSEPIGFIVPAGSLGLSVAVFTICALTTIAILYYRRVTIGAELGGPKASAKRHAALLVGLWFVYIVASILSTEGKI